MQNILNHQEAVAIERRQKFSSKLVAVTTVVISLLTLFFIFLSDTEVFGIALTYFCIFWFFPAGYYIQGVRERKEEKLLWWILSVSLNIIWMVVWCVVILNDYRKYYYSNFDEACIMAVIVLCLLPILLLSLLLSSFVYINMRKDILSINVQSPEIPSQVLTPSRNVAPISRPPNINEIGTATSRISEPGSSILEVASNQCHNVMEGSLSLMTGVLANIRNSGTTSLIDESNDLGENDNNDEGHTNENDVRGSPVEGDPPSYMEAEDLDLPSYEDLGAKRIQIGDNVIVVDKDFQVLAFKDVQNV